MSFPQFCLCGTEPGYTHTTSCPYPLYRGTPTSERAYDRARARLLLRVHWGDWPSGVDLEEDDRAWLDAHRAARGLETVLDAAQALAGDDYDFRAVPSLDARAEHFRGLI